MKKKMKLLALVVIVFTSCAKDIEFCVDGDMTPDAPGTYTYTWCGANADNLEWYTSWGAGTFAGESVSLEFDSKGEYHVQVGASNKRKEDSQSYTITVGSYETRAELVGCSSSPYLGENYRAYAYSSLADLQTDLRNGNFDGCVDSATCEYSFYYNNTISNSDARPVASFTTLTNGNYFIYVQQYDDGNSGNQDRSNLADLIVNQTSVNVSNGDFDDVCQVTVSTDWNQSDSKYLKNLVSKTFELTDVTINGTNTGVSACNADDTFTLNLDKTWEYNVGADDCSGNQSTSNGTWDGLYFCSSSSSLYPTSSSIFLTAASGTLASSSNNYISYYSYNSFVLYSYDGTNIVEFTFTAQ